MQNKENQWLNITFESKLLLFFRRSLERTKIKKKKLCHTKKMVFPVRGTFPLVSMTPHHKNKKTSNRLPAIPQILHGLRNNQLRIVSRRRSTRKHTHLLYKICDSFVMEFVPKKSLYNNIQTKHTYMCRTTSGSIIVDGEVFGFSRKP